MTVMSLPANLPETFYRGAGRIAAFRSAPELPDRPEDWVASTTSRFGRAPDGQTVLPDGRLLADAIAADPGWWLGPGAGTEPGILVKLLDTGQRLPLHVHPDRRFANTHLASPYGKTEAWVILSADAEAYIHLGFHRDVDADELAGWVRDQKIDEMLAATNRVPVHAGEAVLCPAGVPHSIGPGVLLVEVQEPTDLSVLLEYQGFAVDGPAEGDLGLGYDLALTCVDRSTWTRERLAELRGTDRLLPAAADPFFSCERLGPQDRIAAGFSVVVITAGAGTLVGEHDRSEVRQGDTLLIPYAAGPLTISGQVEGLRVSR